MKTNSGDPLRLRAGASTSSAILGKYKQGTEIIVLEKATDSWYEVTCPDGKRGYMYADYLAYVRTDVVSRPETVDFVHMTGQYIEPRQLRDQPFRIYRVVPELTKVTAVSYTHLKARAAVKTTQAEIDRCNQEMCIRDSYYPSFVEFGHAGPAPAPAHPYIRPAYDARADESYEIIREGLRDAIDKS